MTYAVGILGKGEISRRTVTALLNDWHGASPIDIIYVPGHQDHFTSACRFAVDWAEAKGVDYGILMTEGQDMAHLEDYDLETKAGSDPDEPNAPKAVIANSDDVFLAWDSAEDEKYTKVAEEILAAGKRCFDLVDALFPITSAPDDAESDSNGSESSEPTTASDSVKTPERPAQPRAAADEAQALSHDVVREIVREELQNLGLLS